ncbi:MAG: hypothetical protein HC849_06955 [Oscillatoriales cyanobacterium RU_3_3]|nr:hypothetical protein [Microcoleus sp. SU_5_6]NJL67857.1 hypothetical protein [Microcoleus sp. SM1_3_4]NJM59975.1 hypothetical protein [Oscillatoriales cyanobacterium RU_3_3]NJR22547.1 hypothetical protein [Richelia sp. CSU_2_1]
MIAELSKTEAGEVAMEFLTNDLDISIDDREWFSVLDVRPIGETWYVVEIGIEGLPDKWVLQVYDTRECDPSYTFSSPIKATESDTGLEDMPEAIAQILMAERSHN